MKIYEYKYFILESLPQLGVVLFDSALARIDWILLGIISTSVATAEYSFVYKVFELSKLPLLIVAPVLLTRFSKILGNEKLVSDKHKSEIQVFFKLELFIVMLIPIFLISCWRPLVDYFTDDKYGAVNEGNYMILASCIPFLCIINFLWTMAFVQGQLKTILFITISVSVLNICTNAVLIPFLGGRGAALAFLICTLIQFMLYFKFIKQKQIKLQLMDFLIAFGTACLSIIISKVLSNNIIFTSALALFIYVMLAFITRQISIKQIKQVMRGETNVV